MSTESKRRHPLASPIPTAALLVLVTAMMAVGASAAPGDPGLPPPDWSGSTTTSITSLGPYYTATGLVTLSMDGLGTMAASGTIQVDKPAGGTVRKAFLLAASTGYTGATIPDATMTVEGTPIYWDDSIASSIYSSNYIADVTDIVKPMLDAAAPGIVDVTVAEGGYTNNIDGSILAVVFDAPALAREYTAAIFFGAQDINGDDFAIGLGEGATPADPEYVLDFSLGISYGWQGTEQSSLVDVNGIRMTSSAGGQDDGEDANGALITVGGIGDSTDNPADPYELPNGDPRLDDELYNLKPFVTQGDVLINVHTYNPSNDDNIFFGGLYVSGAAVIGEGLLLTPVSASHEIGNQHTVTATLQDTDGNRIPDRDVHFEIIAGPHVGTTSDQMTDADGHAYFMYTGAALGTDTIRASFINSSQETQYSNDVTCEWTTGQVVGCPWVDATTGPLGFEHDSFGLAWGDFDNDGDDDLLLADNGLNHLLRNDLGGNFTKLPDYVGDGACRAACWGDFDDDGWLDLFTVNFGTANRLFHNDEGAGFTDVTTPELADAGHGTACAWADVDMDGDLDLFLANDGEPNVLYINEGGVLTPDTMSPAAFTDASRGCAFGDYDGDQYPDLYVSVHNGPNRMFHNDGAGQFVDASVAPVDDAGDGKGVCWGDYDNDGWLDLYLVNKDGPNKLFHNDGNGWFDDATAAAGVGDMGDGRTCDWGDYDNDGWLDLFVSNYTTPVVMYHNLQDGTFEDATCGALATTPQTAWGAAFDDQDLDGDLDLYVANHNYDLNPNHLFGNVTVDKHWLRIELEGSASNSHGVGAAIAIKAGGFVQTRYVTAGSAYLAQAPTTQQVGLGDAQSAVLTVRWPSGQVQEVPVNDVDRLVTVVETAATAAGDVPEAGGWSLSCRPNPFNPSTTIAYSLPRGADVTLRVYDVTGRVVRTLIAGAHLDAGPHEASWDGRDDRGRMMSSGVYFAGIRAGDRRDRIRMVLVK